MRLFSLGNFLGYWVNACIKLFQSMKCTLLQRSQTDKKMLLLPVFHGVSGLQLFLMRLYLARHSDKLWNKTILKCCVSVISGKMLSLHRTQRAGRSFQCSFFWKGADITRFCFLSFSFHFWAKGVIGVQSIYGSVVFKTRAFRKVRKVL